MKAKKDQKEAEMKAKKDQKKAEAKVAAKAKREAKKAEKLSSPVLTPVIESNVSNTDEKFCVSASFCATFPKVAKKHQDKNIPEGTFCATFGKVAIESNVSNTDELASQNVEEEEEEDECIKISYEGKDYIKSIQTNVVYNMDEEVVGKFNEETKKIVFDEEFKEEEYA